jgi:hypothetical protein
MRGFLQNQKNGYFPWTCCEVPNMGAWALVSENSLFYYLCIRNSLTYKLDQN